MNRLVLTCVAALLLTVTACGGDGSSGSSSPKGLTIASSLPAIAEELAPHDVIQLEFNRELDPSTVPGALLVTSQTVGILGGTTTQTGPSTLLWAPSAPLRLDDQVTVTVQQTLTDIDGESIVVSQARTWDTVRSRRLVQNSALLRSSPSATVLHDGRVLIAGGASRETEAVIYNPATGAFTNTGNLTEGRLSHAAVLLDDGRVAVIGGQSSVHSVVRDTIETWDPGTGAWTVSSATIAPRSEDHTVHRIEDAVQGVRWIVVGGYNSTTPSDVVQTAIDVLDAGMGASVASAASTQLGGKAAVLETGDIAQFGSLGGFAGSDAVEVLSVDPSAADPVTQVTQFTGVLPSAISFLSVVRIPGDSRVLVDANGVLYVIEVEYTAGVPTGATATAGPAHATGEERRYVLFQPLQDGRVFISTGRSLTSLGSVGVASIYEPQAAPDTGTLPVSLELNPRRIHGLAYLDDGRVLNFSGRFQLTGSFLDTMDIVSREALLSDRITGAGGAFSVGMNPRANAGSIPANTSALRVYFTGGLDVSTVNPTAVEVTVNALPLAVTVSIQNRRELVVHLPTGVLATGDVIELELLGGMADLAGNPVDLTRGVTRGEWMVR